MKISTQKELKPVFRALYEQASIMLNTGKIINVEVAEFKNKRNNEQNAYYWLLNGWVAECLNDAGCNYGDFNIPYTAELIHEINKKIFGLKTTTKMDIHEFCEYTTKITQFWQERTQGEFLPKELPTQYLIRKGYDLEYNLR